VLIVFIVSVDALSLVGHAEPPSKHESSVEDTPGVTGENTTSGYGVYGRSVRGGGVAGFSKEASGVYGFSEENHGILGETAANGAAGVAGVSRKDGHGIYGRSDGNGHGVFGTSETGAGIAGVSVKWAGVSGISREHDGVIGETEADWAAGVAGVSKKNGPGVSGRGEGIGFGVWGISKSGAGVVGESTTWAGVSGTSREYNGVVGETEANGHAGVAGVNKKDGNGIYGRSDGNGNGVFGTSTIGAGLFGESVKSSGVIGRSHEFEGVHGETEATGFAAVAGINKKDGTGVFGESQGKGIGVFGFSKGREGVRGATESSVDAGIVGVNQTDGNGIYGQSLGKGIGVQGTGEGGGISGVSRPGVGVFGQSTENHGVLGESQADERAGVAGVNTQHGYGVHGRSEGQGYGVYGTSNLGRGVVGDSQGHDGVVGIAHAAERSGVVGLNDHATGFGVWAASLQGTGLYAKGRTAAHLESDQGVALRIVSEPKSVDNSESSVVEATVGANRVFNITRTGQVSAPWFQSTRDDVAESIRLTDSAEPGDVIEIDPNKPGSFRLAQTANSSAVAGVLIASPGLALGAEETSTGGRDDFLAILGRVPVKVTSENGAIYPGDLLVASSTPGRAMKAPAEPKAGTVIGKALGNMSQDQGEIEMLVMLR
jgi:hypothetical protein